MSGYLLAVDQGTTGSTVVVLSTDARVLARATHEFPQHFPSPGWVEHDVEEIWTSVVQSLESALAEAGVDGADCLGIGITNQRETAVVWERQTGTPIHRAIVWQDRRTADVCRRLRQDGHEERVRAKTGLVLDPYFSGTKVAWLLDNVAGARSRAESGDLAFGTMDTYVLHRLSGGLVHCTDPSNASRTMLFDIHTGAWCDELLELLGVPKSLLPEVRSNSEVYGHTKGVPGLPDGIPIAGMAGDQQSALFGQICFGVGDAKCTYGTGAFLLMNTGEVAVPSQHGLLTTVAWKIGDKTVYALEGSSFIAGAAVQWLRDGLGIIQNASEIEALARQVQSSDGVVFVPALAGLGAPHWDPDARGSITGITRGTTKAHLARATLEGIAFQIGDLVEAMKADCGAELGRLRVDGGAARNDLLMEIQAGVANAPIDRPESVETTALGAAYLAGMAVGVFPDTKSIADAHRVERTFESKMNEEERGAALKQWHEAVGRTRSEV